MIAFTITAQYHWRHFRIKEHKKSFNSDSIKEYQPSEILWKIAAPKLATHLLKEESKCILSFELFCVLRF